jgi:hypothetical protein
MTTSRDDRAATYADLLSALLAARSDPATARFDAEIAEAEAAGTLDGATSRTLRWWQRESMRGIADHLAEVLPGLLVSLVDAERAANQSVADSAAAWASAIGAAHRGPGDHGPGGGGGGVPGVEPPGPGRSPGGASTPHAVVTSITPVPDGPRPVSELPTSDLRHPPSASTGVGAPRQRLLVAGLTVLSDARRPGDTPSPPTL